MPAVTSGYEEMNPREKNQKIPRAEKEEKEPLTEKAVHLVLHIHIRAGSQRVVGSREGETWSIPWQCNPARRP